MIQKIKIFMLIIILAGCVSIEDEPVSDYEKKIDYYSQIISINPQNAKAYDERGELYYQTGRYQDAINDFTEAIKLEPENAFMYYIKRGYIYEDLGQYQEAVDDVNRAIELNPESAEAYSNRGATYYHWGKHSEAIDDFNRALKLNPNDAVFLTNRGTVYYDTGRYQEALDDFNESLRIDPAYIRVYRKRGNTYQAMAEQTPSLREEYLRRANDDFNQAEFHETETNGK